MRGRTVKMLKKISILSDGTAKYKTLKKWWVTLNHKERGAVKK